MKTLSFDVGIKNLAFCFIREIDSKTKNIGLGDIKYMYR